MEITKYQIISIIGLSIIIGVFLGSFWMKTSCNNTIEYLSDTYKDILFKVADIDTDKVLQSYEYCQQLMNDTNLTTLLSQSSKAGESNKGYEVNQK